VGLFENHTKRKLAAGELALGFGVGHLRTAATGLIAAATGHDWLFIDMEHGAMSVHEATQMCLAALPTGVTPIVRVASHALDEATRALDNGAMGVVIPHVDTPDSAREVIRALRYPPQGSRSYGGPPAAFGFKPPLLAEAQAEINAANLIVAMIESSEAVRNAASIAALDGVDVLLIGASDLSTEMGIAGLIGHPRMREAFEAVHKACKNHGKTYGMGGVYDHEMATHYIRCGARFVLAGSDHSYLMSAGKARTEELRESISSEHKKLNHLEN
jgi:2-keto-3-deoxy-L-rhamnonate aldolase RhmA